MHHMLAAIAGASAAALLGVNRPLLGPASRPNGVSRHRPCRCSAAAGVAADWSFLDAAFIISCPDADGSNPRLERVRPLLEDVGLSRLVEVREFARDEEDRVRGCYTSHIAVLQEARRRLAGKPTCNVLVLEDNIDVSPRISTETLTAVQKFVTEPSAAQRDMMHLAYIMYVPGLSVERTPGEEHIVKLLCTPDSVLGTTAYVMSRSGLDALLAEHAKRFTRPQD